VSSLYLESESQCEPVTNPRSVKHPVRKAWPLLARRTTIFEIDRLNDLFFSTGHEATSIAPTPQVAKTVGAKIRALTGELRRPPRFAGLVQRHLPALSMRLDRQGFRMW
jgi:hypothetical protein